MLVDVVAGELEEAFEAARVPESWANPDVWQRPVNASKATKDNGEIVLLIGLGTGL